MIRSLLTLLLLVVGLQSVSAQAAWVHYDKPFYVTEDMVGYQLYLSQRFNNQSIVVKTTLFDSRGDEISSQFNATEGRRVVAGSHYLPAELTTGWYYCSFRIFDLERNAERIIIDAPFAVYNDQIAAVPTSVTQREPERFLPVTEAGDEALMMEIFTFPENPVAGEETEVLIRVRNRRGRPIQADLSVAINDWSLLSPSLAMGMDNLLSADDSLRLPDMSQLANSIYWQGSAYDSGGRPVGDGMIRATATENGDATYEAAVSRRGYFTLLAPYYEGDMTFSWQDGNGNAAMASQRKTNGDLADLPPLYLSPAVFRYLQLNRQRKQLNAFRQTHPYPGGTRLAALGAREARPTSIVRGGTPGDAAEWNGHAADTGVPSRPSLVWNTNLQTNEYGEVRFSYQHGDDVSAYRIDVVAQEIRNGGRGRHSVVYRMAKPSAE